MTATARRATSHSTPCSDPVSVRALKALARSWATPMTTTPAALLNRARYSAATASGRGPRSKGTIGVCPASANVATSRTNRSCRGRKRAGDGLGLPR